MKYCVVNRGDQASLQVTERLHQLASRYPMSVDDKEPELIVSIGGDGTMLHAFHLFQHRLGNASFVGVHTGHLGFFADWMPDELEHLLELINKPAPESKLRLVQYPLLQIELCTEQHCETHLALNEFTLKGIESTLVAQLNINDEMFEMFRGDGICISTPCGSTAYNKSLGGAVIHPSLEALQIAEISSINNRVYRTLGSSMILPKHHYCDIYPKNAPMLVLTLDHKNMKRNDIVSIRLRVAPERIMFARYRPFPFWSRVREAFIGHEVK